MEKGRYNKISDVAGVLVGHRTVEEGDVHTGVTVILPRPQIFRHKCPAAVHVINGFGKSSGLLQIEEMGVLESPIALTNTLSVGMVQQDVYKRQADRHPVPGSCLLPASLLDIAPVSYTHLSPL